MAQTQLMRQIKSFEGESHTDLTSHINEWISKSHAIPISISVTETTTAHLMAFVIYETSTETHRNLGMR